MKMNYHNKSSRRKKYRPQKYVAPRNPIVSVLERILDLIYFVAVVFISLHPGFESFSKEPWFIITTVLVTVALHIFYAIAEKDHEHPLYALAMLLAIPAYLLFLFCESGRLFQAIYAVLLPIYVYIFIVYSIYQEDRCREPGDFAIALPLVLIFINTTNAWYIPYLNETTHTKYFLISLIAAVLSVIVCIYLMKRRILKTETTSGSFKAVFLSFLISATIVFSLLNTFNYSLDTSTPKEFVTEITNKNESGSSKDTLYHIYVDVNGEEIEFRTGLKTFSQIEEGDKVKVLLHKGFFGDEYYILD
ncbi:MAG: hypothetical protein IJ499_04595 [Clostridia bacterium]|nr:hypothetical protein [Clostridia bacterium]